MNRLAVKVENSESAQTLCELELWRPPQGTIPESVPLSLDLDFDNETIRILDTIYVVGAKRVTLQLGLIDADLVRGSRLGEHALDPHMTTEVTQSVRRSMETEAAVEGSIEIEVSPNPLGRLTSRIFFRKRRSKKSDKDHVLKALSRVSRVTPRTKKRWDIREPLDPSILKGRYIGTSNDQEVGPLCLCTMRGKTCEVLVVITVKRQDLSVTTTDLRRNQTRNKNAILDQMVKRTISSDQIANFVLPLEHGQDDILLAKSVMEISVED